MRLCARSRSIVSISSVKLEREADANKMFLVTCSYFEIYNEVTLTVMHDLLRCTCPKINIFLYLRLY